MHLHAYFVTARAAWHDEVSIMTFAEDISVLQAIAQINKQLSTSSTDETGWMPQGDTGTETWCKHCQFTCCDLLFTAAAFLKSTCITSIAFGMLYFEPLRIYFVL
jgi:hypothetical protein